MLSTRKPIASVDARLVSVHVLGVPHAELVAYFAGTGAVTRGRPWARRTERCRW